MTGSGGTLAREPNLRVSKKATSGKKKNEETDQKF